MFLILWSLSELLRGAVEADEPDEWSRASTRGERGDEMLTVDGKA